MPRLSQPRGCGPTSVVSEQFVCVFVCLSALFVRVGFYTSAIPIPSVVYSLYCFVSQDVTGRESCHFYCNTTGFIKWYTKRITINTFVCIYIKVFILYNNTLVFINNTNSDIRTDLFHFVAFVVLFCIPDNMITFFCLWSEVATSSPAATSAIAR